MRFIALFLVIIHSLNSFAQKDYSEKPQAKNGFYFQPTQLVLPEIIMTFEHFIKPTISLSYSAGYKIPTGDGSTLQPFGPRPLWKYEYQYAPNRFLSGIFISVAPSFYMSNKTKFFLSPELLYRHYYLDNKRLQFDNEELGYKYNSIRSEKINVLGIKLLAGFNNLIRFSEKWALNIKTFSGIGVRYKWYYYQNIDNIVENPFGGEKLVPFEEESGDMFAPSFHLSVKLGIVRTEKTTN